MIYHIQSVILNASIIYVLNKLVSLIGLLNCIESYNSTQLVLFGDLNKLSLIIHSLFLIIIYTPMFFPSPPLWRLLKTLPIIFQLILLVQPIPHVKYLRTVMSQYSWWFQLLQKPCSTQLLPIGITLSTFCVEFNTICILPYIQCQNATLPTMFRVIWTSYGYHMYIILTILKLTNVRIVRTPFLTCPFLLKVQSLWIKYLFLKTSQHVKDRFDSTLNAPVRIRLYTLHPSLYI